MYKSTAWTLDLLSWSRKPSDQLAAREIRVRGFVLSQWVLVNFMRCLYTYWCTPCHVPMVIQSTNRHQSYVLPITSSTDGPWSSDATPSSKIFLHLCSTCYDASLSSKITLGLPLPLFYMQWWHSLSSKISLALSLLLCSMLWCHTLSSKICFGFHLPLFFVLWCHTVLAKSFLLFHYLCSLCYVVIPSVKNYLGLPLLLFYVLWCHTM